MSDTRDGAERPWSDVNRREFLRLGVAGLGAAAGLPDIPPREAEQVTRSPAGTIRVRQTTGMQRHAERPAVEWKPSTASSPGDVVLKPDRRAQEILGFGAAFTDAACYMLSQLTPDARRQLFHDLFHPSQMGLSVGRICIGSSDYATEAYSYDESPTPDPELAKFSIEHDRKYVLPILREARGVNSEIFLLASPWSPPGWMKDNNSMLGGTIRRRYLPAYANYVTKFVQAYAAAGVAVNAVTSQNEVDTDQDGRMPACTWPQEIEVAFVGQQLGPAFQKAGVNTKIWLIDHNYNLWGRALASFDDEAVRKYADGVAWHGYVGSADAMTRVQDAYPQKHMYWTEGGPDITDPKYQTDWTQWAAQMAGILRHRARCIIGWNYALDEHGKPNIGPFSCGGLVTVHSQTKDVTRSGQYWAFAHFASHVRRGARVFESTGLSRDVTHVGFENPDGSRVLVLANAGAAPAQQRIVLGQSVAQVALPADSVTTLAWSG